MGEKEDKEKAEKLAAAKKRVAQLQKKKKAAASGTADKTTKDGEKSTIADEPQSPTKAKSKKSEKADEESLEAQDDEEGSKTTNLPKPETSTTVDEDEDESNFNEVIKSANASKEVDNEDDEKPSDYLSHTPADGEGITNPKHKTRQPSLSLQSKLRSSSFRDSGPLSPAAAQASRIEELEKENKKINKEAEEHENRWRKVEGELQELREKIAEENAKRSIEPAVDSDVVSLRAEIESLKRQQRQSPAAGFRNNRRESTNHVGQSDETGSLRKEVESKDSTISDMQLEISRLRSQLSNQTQGCETHGEQIAALQTSLSTTETKLRAVESELSTTKKSLSRASEKAMLDGTERTSKETKIKSLEREAGEANAAKDDAVKKAELLEKKVEAMNKLHREAEARNASKLSSAEQSARDVPGLRAKIERLESEILRWREKHKRTMSGGGGDEGLDELEDEERQKLEKRIRELEAENFDLQRGVWRDKRLQMQMRGDEMPRASFEAQAEDFDEVDLSGSGPASRKRSFNNQPQLKHSGFTQVLNSGLAAFRAATASPDAQMQSGRPRNDSLLQDLDDDLAFDEQAFAQAQREEEARQMVEHVREVKKGLKQWTGWRLDLADARRVGGGAGVGEVFDV